MSQEKSSSIQLLRSAVDTGKKDYQTALEAAQRLHADQRTILEDQIKMVGTVLDPLDAEGGTKIKKGKDKDSKENCAQRITLCTWKEAPQVELCPVFLTFLSLFFL